MLPDEKRSHFINCASRYYLIIGDRASPPALSQGLRDACGGLTLRFAFGASPTRGC